MSEYLDYLPLVLSGTRITIEVSLLSLFTASFLGIIAALAKLSKSLIARRIGGIYTTLVRGVPDLVMILLVFYGSQILLNSFTEKIGIDYIIIEPFISGVLTIGFIYGAYMAETFRGAILAIEKGQIEAGHAFGMNSWQVFFRVTFPLMVRHAMAGYVNNWLVLIKSTALISIIGLEDLIRKSNIAGSITKKPFSFLMTSAAIYIIITGLSMIVLKWFERKYKVAQ